MPQAANLPDDLRRTTPPVEPASGSDDITQAREQARRARFFGIWSDSEDGLAYQERMRSEWEADAGE
jgi:hypothetical protein